MSVLERENLILRHWAGVYPANRYLLGRGPTGCDTTKPLIADENDPEIQIVIDEASPRDRSWPPASAVPPARPPFVQEQGDSAGPMSSSQAADQQSMIPSSPITPTTAPVFEKQGAFDSSSYPDAHKFKPHPLYDQRPMFGDYPAHVSNFEQSVPPMAAERLLVKRESIYAPPSQPSLSSLLSHQQRTDIPSHDYYHSQSRPSYQRPDAFSSQPINGVHPEIGSSSAAVGPTTYHTMYPAHLVSWPDAYTPHSSSTPAPQLMNRRQQPASALTPLTPVIPPVGLTSNSGSNGSPSSQPTSATGSVPDQQRPPAMSADPMYAPRRSVAYTNGFPSSTGTPTSSSYMPSSAQGQSTMYSHHGDGSQQAQSQQQQQQQRQRQYHDGSVNSDSFRQ